ncbi:HAD-IIIC family phosphatase [Methylobacterium sp. SyP6R]|uniref:HAD-IIIC family phosphatase n=1 Tax=Methylobacterium sp. SyP6R TaxID=2718876 RepID=UPI001F4585D8|nr:HAD-IIIC family phosphatase [Methylobacterium sp. SyP6R]MCF4129211.1 HAD-IIIC family phosphatase [Methylobacterium sp. SyP6R]
MDAADFLFPRDLEVTPIQYPNILFIGSCLSEAYVIRLRDLYKESKIDYILFNNAAELPEKDDDEIGHFDLQYIQLPLRSVLTDAALRQVDAELSRSPVDWIALGKANIDRMLENAIKYNLQTGILTLLSNFVVPQRHISASLYDENGDSDLCFVVSELNKYLSETARCYANMFVADIESIAASVGKRYFLDDAIVFSTHGSVIYPDWSGHEHMPYWTAPDPGRIEPIPDLGTTYENRTEEFFRTVFRQIEAMYRSFKQIDMVKVVIFDLDNTLWRGQLVEHYQPGEKWPYSDGWPLGLWEAVHHLRRRGIMTAIASKNDQHLVEQKWDDAVQPPFVKFSDFVAAGINWEPKAENIRAILQKLSLTPASAVFVDDNPVERESVKAALPGIRTIGSDPFVIRRILLWSPETQIAKRSSESQRREQMLRQQFAREEERASMSREDFLSGLGSTLSIWEVADHGHRTFSRIFELVNKTNQFNTTGIRWGLEDYRAYFESGGTIHAFSVKDRFTEYGTVGVVFTRESRIQQFVMSCRVLGMEIETAVMAHIVAVLRRDRGASTIEGQIVETNSNTPCRDVFKRCQFVEAGSQRLHYALAPGTAPRVSPHVRIEVTDG